MKAVESGLVSSRSASLAPRNPPECGDRGEYAYEAPVGCGADPGPDGECGGAGQGDDDERGAGGVLHGQSEGEQQDRDDEEPPPTPRKRVSSPTTVAVISTFSARGHWQAKVGLKVMIGSARVWRLT